MTQTRNSNSEPLSKERCPVTGWPVFRKPEWTEAHFGDEFRVTVRMIGDGVIHARARGKARADSLRGALQLIHEAVAETIGADRPYVEIHDWTDMKGGSREARKVYLAEIKDNKRLLALIYIGVSPLLKISINIIKRFKILGVKVTMVNSYTEAMTLAREILAHGPRPEEKTPSPPPSPPREAFHGESAPHRAVSSPDWFFSDANFSLRFEIIDGRVLHGVSTGRLDKKHVAPCMALQEEVTRSMGAGASRYWYVLGLVDSKGVGQKGRKLYVKSVLELLKKYPVRMFILYGVNQFIRAGVHLAKTFVSVKVGVVKDLDAALDLIAGEQGEEEGSRPPPGPGADRSENDSIRRYVHELLQFIEGIDWGSDGVDKNKPSDPDHPFMPVYEAIELIKWELDDLFREREQAQRDNAELESRLQRARKMEAIGTLAGGVAHDLNNILSGIVSYPELLLMEIPEDSPLRRPLSTIKKSGEKAAAIVLDLLTLARRGVSVSRVVNLNDIISEYLKSPEYKRMKHYHPEVRVDAALDETLLNILGSPVHLSKTVMNLISNAAEAMPDGGRLAISTKNKHLDAPLKGYDDIERGDYVVLKVSDAGVGISPEDQERIFEPFYTKKVMGRSGTGLGMAVIWGAVKDHYGYIDVQSVEGAGSSFTLYFPVTRREPPRGETPAAGDALKGNGESILVVDDVEEQRTIASAMLIKLGYSVATADGGEAAAAHLKKHSADLLVLDMIMDPGIDGLDTYKRIIELHPGQKAIIASGFAETDRVKEAQDLGAGAYIKKPYTLEKIGRAVKGGLGGGKRENGKLMKPR
ncbi:MAG: response regulator [Desulfobacterales bacterium]|nr:response regulator [Desulfobacterales bacterium]